MSVLSDLGKENVGVESLAKKALKDEKVLSELLEGLKSSKDKIRYSSFKVLLFISEEHPEVLYPHWDEFVEKLSSDNSYHKYQGIFIIANLTRADKENKFEKIFNKYSNLLDDESFIVAANLAGNLGKIAKAKPKLQTEITNKLLSIDKTHFIQERKDLMKSGAIESFNEYFEEAENKNKIIEFVKEQLNSKSPKTRRKAKEFLKKWE